MTPINKPHLEGQTRPIALTVAGSDSGAGAGIQADLKTFAALDVYGCSAITSLTAQNTCGVQAISPVPAEFVAAQMHSVLSDMPVDVIKTGMLANAEVVQALVAEYDRCYPIPLVVDPVMVATSGDPLLERDAIEGVRDQLLPRATLITPNLHEAAALLDTAPAQTTAQAERHAERLLDLGAEAVLLTGGHHNSNDASDLLLSPAGIDVFSRPRTDTPNTHGTGCTLASAIAAGLAQGLALNAAVSEAKSFLHHALVAGSNMRLGHGSGPVHHFYRLEG